MKRLVLGSLILGAGIVFCDSARADTDSIDVVNGSPSTIWPAVGVLTDGQFLCTAFAVSTQWLVTAGHCLDGQTAANFSFLVGAQPLVSNVSYAVDEFVVHPSYNAATLAYDIGLAHIKSVDLPLTPIKVNSQALTNADVGRTVDLLGYGATTVSSGDAGIKRLGQTTIAEVNAEVISNGYSPAGACFGDSGAPLFVYDVDGFPMALGEISIGDCTNPNVSQRLDTKVADFLALHVVNLCIDGGVCDGVFRNGLEDPL